MTREQSAIARAHLLGAVTGLVLAALIVVLCLAVHGCATLTAPATMLPTAPPSLCVNAQAGDHVWVGSREMQCAEDPTSFPSDPSDYYQLHRPADAGAPLPTAPCSGAVDVPNRIVWLHGNEYLCETVADGTRWTWVLTLPRCGYLATPCGWSP